MNTSKKTYTKVMESGLLSKRRKEVYKILYDHGALTGSEVSKIWRKENNYRGTSETVRNRITELMKMEVVKVVGLRLDPYSKQEVSVFSTNNKLPKKLPKKESKSAKKAKVLSRLEGMLRLNELYNKEDPYWRESITGVIEMVEKI